MVPKTKLLSADYMIRLLTLVLMEVHKVEIIFSERVVRKRAANNRKHVRKPQTPLLGFVWFCWSIARTLTILEEECTANHIAHSLKPRIKATH